MTTTESASSSETPPIVDKENQPARQGLKERGKALANSKITRAILIGIGLIIPLIVAIPPAQKTIWWYWSLLTCAEIGKSLIIVTDFDEQNARFSDSLVYDLTVRVSDANLTNVSVKRFPFTLSSAEEARAVGSRCGAKLVIWGFRYESVIRPYYEMFGLTDDIDLSFDLAEATSDQGNFIAYITETLPNQSEYLMIFSAGLIAYSSKQYDQAISLFDELLMLNINESDPLTLGYDVIYFYRGFAHRRQGHLEVAIHDYTQAIEINPDFAQAYRNRGYVYHLLGIYQLAVNDYSRAIELELDNADTYYNRGLAYAALGMYSEAIVDYDSALQQNPTDRQVLMERAGAYAGSGDMDRASSEYQNIIETSDNVRDQAIAYNNFAYALMTFNQDYEAALDNVQNAIDLIGGEAEFFHTRGAIYFEMGEIDSAIADFNEAIRLNSEISHAYRDLGRAYFQQGEVTLALEALNEAARLNGYDAETYYWRAQVYEAQGDVPLADADYQQYLNLASPTDSRVAAIQQRLHPQP